MAGALHRAVLRSRKLPGLGALYRAAYALALRASARALGSLPGTAAVYLHRGLSRVGWEPGVSDIDLICVRDARPRDEGEALSRLAARLAVLRRLFPMLGDIWLGSAEELGRYLRWGGLRAWEDPPDWRLVCGAAPERPALEESLPKRRWLDPWSGLFVSHVELCRRFLGRAGGPAEKREADIRKLHLDAARYSDFILDGDAAGPAPLTRAQARARWPEAARLSPRGAWLDSSRRLARASRLVLGKTASRAAQAAELPAAAAKSAAQERLAGLLAGVRAARGAVSDLPYHTYLILDDGASRADYAQAADRLLARPQPGVSLVLEPAAWALALQSSYLGAPLGWLGSGAGRGSAQGEALFPGWGACAAGGPLDVPVLPERLRWEVAAEAASWMLLWWRPLWIARGWDNRFVLYHLTTRALGLRLILEGKASGPFCDWELLLARASARLPAERRALLRLEALLRSESSASLGSVSRRDLADGHLAAAAGLMAGLREALSSQRPKARALSKQARASRARPSR